MVDKKPIYRAWDSTYLYHGMYKSLQKMQQYIIGDKSHCVLSTRFIRQFKEAVELCRRLADDDCGQKEYAPFCATIPISPNLRELFGADTMTMHVIYKETREGKRRKRTKAHQAYYVIRDQYLARLAELIQHESSKWWD